MPSASQSLTGRHSTTGQDQIVPTEPVCGTSAGTAKAIRAHARWCAEWYAHGGRPAPQAVRQGLADRYGEPPREVEVHPVAWGDRYAGTAAVAGRRVTISARLVVEGGELRAVWESAPADPLPKE